jgi:hypothetical protein
MTNSHQKAAHMLNAVADLLDQGLIIHRLSVALTAIAAAVLLVPLFPAPPAFIPVAIVVVVAGIAEIFIAIRIGLDAALFRRMAADAAADQLDAAAYDSAVQALRILPLPWSAKPIPKRVVGAKRLLVFQSAALMVQFIAAVSGALAMFMEWV